MSQKNIIGADQKKQPTGQMPEVILGDDKKAFRTQDLAIAKLENLSLAHDVWGVLPFDNGFAIVNKTSGEWQAISRELEAADIRNRSRSKNKKKDTDTDQKSTESYHVVRFHHARAENEPRNVVLRVNGDTITIARGVSVTLPDRFLECARHATYPRFKQLPGEARKVVGQIAKYPFDMIGPGTEEDYIEQRATGTAQVKASLLVNPNLAPAM